MVSLVNLVELKKLRDYVDSLEDVRVDMEDFVVDLHNKCGSVCCVLGHYGEMLGIDAPTTLGGNTNYNVLCEKHLGIRPFGDIWEFLFDSQWARNYFDGVTTQKDQAVKRMDIVLSNGGVCPDDWDYRYSVIY